MLDALPRGATILNLSEDKGLPLLSSTRHFALAGKGLSNRVIPIFEVQRQLSADFVRQRKVDYIVDRGPFHDDVGDLSSQGIEVKVIYDETRTLAGPVDKPWRVWEVIR
jgi:hypothetical protein